MKILEWKSKILEKVQLRWKNSQEELNSIFELAEERISVHEDRLVEIMCSNEQGEKKNEEK